MNRTVSMLLALACAPAGQAAVDVCMQFPGGFIPEGTVWTKGASPYRVRCDLQVAGLTIEPGVRVVFEGDHLFQVTGWLTAIGTAAEPILFTSASPGTITWRGILVDGTQPGSELVHCVVEYANTSGLRLFDSTPRIERCTFRKNSKSTREGLAGPVNQSGEGGGLEAVIAEGDLVLTECSFVENTSSHGGGLRVEMGTGTLRMEGCVVRGNAANPAFAEGSYHGGGLHVSGRSELRKSLFEDNLVRACAVPDRQGHWSAGGGIFTEGGPSQLVNCIVRRNTAEGGCFDDPIGTGGLGAGLYLASNEIELTNCIIAYNVSSHGSAGSGVFIGGGTARIINSTIYGNNNTGLYRNAGTVTLLNSILWCNNSACINPNPRDQISGAVTAEYSCIQGGYAGTGNIASHPVFASTTELRIARGSPCIDRGHPHPAYDDACRPPALGGSPRNDMGAHGGPGGCGWSDLPWDCNGNLIVDAEDIANGTSSDCDANGIPDECDIAAGRLADSDGDGVPDRCAERSVRLVLTGTRPRLTYAVELTSDARFLGGELAIGVDPAVLRILAVRPLRPPLPAAAEFVLNPADPAAAPMLQCAGGRRAGVTLAWHHDAQPLNPGTHRLFEIEADFIAGAPAAASSPVEFIFCLGPVAAPIANVITAEDGRSLPLFARGVTAVPGLFIRGDANDDGRFDISDVIAILNCLFRDGRLCPPCRDALDADDTGVINMSDPIYLLNWRFGAGPAPPPPFPGCGRDPTDDDILACSSFHCGG
jgi:hypothetical protein